MRHRVYGKHLGRNKNQRTALFKNLVRSLLLSGTIQTTETKAKAIKGLVDQIITQAKSNTTQRLVSQFLTDKAVVEKLFNEITPKLSDRVSGYTSVVKVGRRLGDGGMMVRMSLLTKETKVESAKGKESTAQEGVILNTSATLSVNSSEESQDVVPIKVEDSSPKAQNDHPALKLRMVGKKEKKVAKKSKEVK